MSENLMDWIRKAKSIELLQALDGDPLTFKELREKTKGSLTTIRKRRDEAERLGFIEVNNIWQCHLHRLTSRGQRFLGWLQKKIEDWEQEIEVLG